MTALLPHHRAAVDSIFRHFRDGEGSPLVVHPMGAGTATVIAGFIAQACGTYTGTRVAVVAQSLENVSDIHGELLAAWPEAPASVCCAGLHEHDTKGEVVIGTIHSLAIPPWPMLPQGRLF